MKHNALTRPALFALGSLISIGTALAEQVIFTEIQYNAQAGQPEFIEVKNNTGTPMDFGTWAFTNGVDYTFPDFNPGDTDAHIFQPFETILVSPVSATALRTAYPSIPAGVRIFGPYTGALSNSGETLTLSDKNGVIMTTVEYNDGGKWPASADGTGHTLSRINPNLTNYEWRNWAASSSIGGTPGEDNTIITTPLLVISEVHFGPDGNTDWIELHSPTTTVSGAPFKLSSEKTLSDAVSLSGTIPAGGYQSFPAVFTPDLNGDINLFLSGGPTILDAVRLDRDNGEESFQSLPVGKEFYGGPGSTQDQPNNPSSRQTDIVINEIMYDAPSDQGTGEYIELYNRGTESVDLSGWEISDGVRFDFPAGTSLPAGGYLVIAADATCLVEGHGTIPVVGDWRGGLRDGGELLRIEDQNGNLVDEVDYLPEGDWPNFADGDGSSMELRHPDMNNDISTAWADSDESQKSTMESFSYTADFLRSTWLPLTSNQELQTHLVGDAHVIIENVSVKQNNSGSNLVQNPGTMSPTESSASGWVCQGTHWASFMDAGKLNLIADGHGDNKANRAEVDMTAPVVGESYTLTFDGRWVSGKSRIIFQTLDHGFGTSFLLPIPANLGTPGAANSALLGSAAPTVTGVIHSPAVPSNSVPVTVSARIESADALTSAELVYRLDNSTGSGTWVRSAMTNDGSGLFSTTVSNYTAQGNIVQFYVEATSGVETTFQPRYGADRPAMWIVDNRTMPSQLLRERFIVSNYDRAALTTSIGGGPTFDYNFPRMSNHFFNATFIANESEIHYNAEIRKSGSPFTRSTNSNIDHGKWKLPGDRLFRGRRRSVIDASGTTEGSGTPRYYDDRIARYFLYQLGHPINEMEFVHSVVNTLPFKLRENHEPISNDFLNRNFADGNDGTLLRIDDEWRFTSDNGDTRSSRNADWSYKDTDNPTAYQSEWIMRTRETDHDFSTFIEFTRELDSNDFDEEKLARMANADMLSLNAVVRGYDADWDTITVNRGKNAYLYRPKDGDGWMLLHWDGDRVFERTGQAILGNRTGVSKYFSQPYIRRQMHYYMTKLLDEHTKGSARTLAWMDAETAAVAGTGVIMPKSHYTNWFDVRENLARNFIGSANANAAFAVTTNNAPTTDDVFTLAGTSPPTVFEIRVVGADDTQLSWPGTTTWELSGITLQSGTNTLSIEGIDHDGNVIEQTTFTITKSNNAAPVIIINSTPKSLNLATGEPLALDATESFDPEGDMLTLAWAVMPNDGVDLTSGPDSANIIFSKPGFYLVTASTTDNAAQMASKTIGVSVYRDDQFSTFGSPQLENFWTSFRATKHDNAPSGPYYSLQDHDGRLTINIPLSTTPLGLPAPMLPPAVQYVDYGDVWKYDDSNAELTGTFAQPNFDDSAWESGPGFLGVGETGLPAPGLQTSNLRKDSAAGLVTYYFRTEFEFTGDPIGAQLSIDHLVDDGVRYYLNGQVIGNVRLPEGVIDSNTVGTKLPVEDVVEENVLIVDVSSSIVQGTNVFAAEVHNERASSSDVVFGTRMRIAANPVGNGVISLDDAEHPWVKRPLPGGDWILQTEVKLEKAQFGEFYAGLLVQANQGGNAFRYGVGFANGTEISAFRVNPSGNSETIGGGSAIEKDIAVVRIEKTGDLLKFQRLVDGAFALVHQITLPTGTTFSTGGVFASTEVEQSIEASFDYAMLIQPIVDYAAWMMANGFTDPNAEYGNTGLNNLLAYALGADLGNTVEPQISSDGGAITFSHRQRIADTELDYSVESSTNLIDWQPAGDLTPQGDLVPNADGTFTVNLLSNIEAANRPEVYYRLIVTLP
ncbi:lamin tail domain-containing protein [Akkermansiaceae bacterium]|nr:lamin tail domain-containing protein [Akkermansiaceae bacterium]MDB4289193.1 lamin tail domain-containing protein [bacterium]MDB4321770.1 lamin tail domain-containing protein [Akkermansiaceae bacterium]MDB4381974.1 lamin tail domain-containing protein [Akkermansiaceae bacterium]MDB4411885.1 lamin tail domain-containing protein [Akkermansiaceae bacterium]